MRSDTGPFALVPVWVLDLPISHLALRVYAVHSDWADRHGAHFHGRKQIAQRLGVSLQAVDEAHKSLVHHRALRIDHRRDAAGDPTSNRYVVVRTIQGVAKQETLPSQADLATGSQADLALTRSKAINHQEGSAPEEAPLPPAELKKRLSEHPVRRQRKDRASA